MPIIFMKLIKFIEIPLVSGSWSFGAGWDILGLDIHHDLSPRSIKRGCTSQTSEVGLRSYSNPSFSSILSPLLIILFIAWVFFAMPSSCYLPSSYQDLLSSNVFTKSFRGTLANEKLKHKIFSPFIIAATMIDLSRSWSSVPILN